MKKLVYVAGPLYTPAERSHVEKIAKLCEENGFNTYLPHRDGGIYSGFGPTKKFFLSDLKAMQKASLCVAVLDGFDVDSGTSFELGYCFARKVPIIGILMDIRFPKPKEQINLMIVDSAQKIVTTYQELEKEIRRFI